MVKEKWYVDVPTTRTFSVNDMKVELGLRPGVFCPAHGAILAENISVRPGERVLDIGTGTGFLGITAAMLGGDVTVVDIDPQAVQLALKNARRNGVHLHGQVGSYFPDDQSYDYIIANLPQEELPPAYTKRIGGLEKSINSSNGNNHLLRFLDMAAAHMHEQSRAIFPVYTPSNYLQTLQKVTEKYDAKLLDIISTPVKQYMQDHIEWYLSQQWGRQGLFKKDNTWHAGVLVYEVQKK